MWKGGLFKGVFDNVCIYFIYVLGVLENVIVGWRFDMVYCI